MVNKYLECLSVEGNYSKARIGCLLMAIFSIAVFIWLVVLTAQISNAKKGEDDNEPKLECMTKDKKKCVFPFLDGDSQHDKCEWKDKKFECATEVNKDNKPASVGDCLYQCELKVEGYTQKFLYDGKKLLSCSNKQHIKINPNLDTMGCKDLCDKEKDCKFFYTTDSKYCVTYKSCDEHRTVTGRAGTTFQKIEDPVNPTVPTPTVEPTKGPVTHPTEKPATTNETPEPDTPTSSEAPKECVDLTGKWRCIGKATKSKVAFWEFIQGKFALKKCEGNIRIPLKGSKPLEIYYDINDHKIEMPFAEIGHNATVYVNKKENVIYCTKSEFDFVCKKESEPVTTTATTTNTTAQPPAPKECKTKPTQDADNPVPESDCIFPFKYGQFSHDSCTKAGEFLLPASHFWCATSVNNKTGKMVAGKWGQCNDKCPKEDD